MFDNLTKYKYSFTAILIILLTIAITKAPLIQVDTNITQFFNEDDSDYQFYQEMNSEFSSQENIILLGLKSEDSIFNTKFLQKTSILIDSIKLKSHVKNVKSILNLSFPVKTAFGISAIRYINKNQLGEFTYDKTKILNDPLSKNFINKQGNSLIALIEIEPNLSTKQLENLVDSLHQILAKSPDLQTFLWGRKIFDVSFKNILVSEIFIFGFWIFVFLCLSLLFIFKKPKALFFPIALVITVIVLFIGGMATIGKPISTLSNLFPTIILIVAVSDVIHLCIKYDTEIKNGTLPKQAISNTLKEIGFTTLITSFTTAIGFLVLCLSPMQAMRNFGLESASLVIITFVLTFVVLPIFFYKSKDNNLFTISKPFHILTSWMFQQLKKIHMQPNAVVGLFLLLFMICCYGIKFINTNSTLYSIPQKTKLHDSYDFYESNFGGSRTFELILSSKNNEKLNTPTHLKTIYAIENYLTNHKDLQFIKSPVDYYRILNQAYHPSNHKITELPLDNKTVAKYEKQLTTFLRKDYFANKERTHYKFTGQMRNFGKHDLRKIQKDILSNINQIIASKSIEAKLSGIDLLIDKSQNKSIESTLWGLLLAIFMVAVTLGLVYKNFILGLLAVILNIIPLLMTAGIMGYFDIDLRAEIALIFTVGFVIAVDDTIHLLSKFQWERKKGFTVEEAIIIAVQECGKAILATSIILVGGFFILMGSNSLEIFSLGLLVGLMVIITLAVDLILAPVIILKWFKKTL